MFLRLQTLIINAANVVDLLIPVVFGLILLAFLWGLAKFVYSADSEEGRKQGKSIMIGGVIALFVASSIWGIIEFMQQELGIGGRFSQPAPGAPGASPESDPRGALQQIREDLEPVFPAEQGQGQADTE